MEIDAVEDVRPGRTPTAEGGFRLRITHGLALILASAAGAALWAKVYRMIGGAEGGSLTVDVATLTVVAITLTGIAVGCWRRSSLNQIFLQLAACFAIVLGLIAVVESDWRIGRYWLQVIFGITVTLPLVAATLAERSQMSEGLRAVVGGAAHVLLCSMINLSLVLLGSIIQFYSIAYMGEI